MVNAQADQSLRQAFKRLVNPGMVLLWRLGLGAWCNAWPTVGGRILVLAHTGRKTGRRRLTPINYAIVNGELYGLAGFGETSDWYRNVKAKPQIELWLPDGWWAGTVEDVSEDERRGQLMRAVLFASGFAAPLFGVDPRRLTDEQIAATTKDYRLLRFHQTEARTGPHGPGDLAWVWPVTTLFLLIALWRRVMRAA